MTYAVDSILVVDDTTDAKGLVEMLNRAGYGVLIAPDPESALEQARSAMPLLVMLDVTMPGLDGYEICRRLKASPSTADIPVIFVTSPGDPESKAKGFAVGGADYVVRPFEHNEVLARVRTNVRLRKLELQSRASHAHDGHLADHAPASSNGGSLQTLQEIERRHFVAVLTRTRGVIEGPNGAAKMLDLKPSTARFRIRKLGIRREDFVVR